jgi:hypothetical protein
MATVITSTATTRKLPYPDHGSICRAPDGSLFAFVRTASTTYGVYKSTDGGSTWNARTGFTRSNLIEWSSFVTDSAGACYLAYRVNDGSTDRLFVRRFFDTTNAWESEAQVSGTSGSGDPSGFWQGVDVAVRRMSNGTTYIVVVGAFTSGTTQYGALGHVLLITSDGAVALRNNLISGTRSWKVNGTAPGRSGVAIDIEHNGDGYTLGSSPAVWITFGRSKRWLVKMSWNGSGWTGPANPILIESSVPASDYAPGRWDGSRFLMAALSSTTTSWVDVFDRNQANTLTTVLTTPTHPQGGIRAYTVTYDRPTSNVRVYAVGTSNSTLYAVDYLRATTTWTSWVQVSADTITSTSPALVDEFGVRRGGTAGNARHDLLYTTGTTTPWTVKNVAQVAAYNPNTPTWDTSATPYFNGGAADVAASLLLDWTFTDADPTDTQSAYALRRQIGAGAFSYWNAGTTTWGASEVFNSSATTQVTLSSGWGADSDANHSYAVKVRDASSLDSGYSSSLTLTPSAKVNPTITAPTAAQVINANNVTVTWTVAAQKQYRVVLLTNPGGVAVSDSGWVSDPAALSYDIPYEFPDNTGWTVQLTTTNTEGLASTTQTRNFTIDYTEPATPTLAVSAQTALGVIRVVITNPTPSGGQPAVSYQDLYRRPVGTSGSGVRVATLVASGATVDDWRVPARVAVEYRTITYGVNGTLIASAWTA